MTKVLIKSGTNFEERRQESLRKEMFYNIEKSCVIRIPDHHPMIYVQCVFCPPKLVGTLCIY